jgi:hypothetical protein
VSDWWEQGYPGGPMVAVKGFPRSLYPPDATGQGKQPSVDGSDIEAYKRTVSRAGRWEWQAFDQQFSNGFAHGKQGGWVSTSGVAGVQRQGGLKDTGWVGQDTFNLLRSIRIPAGLPHAGEAAMDATAVELINAAYNRFKGKEPAGGGSSSAQARLKKAVSQIGVKESPPNSNRCRYTDWYGMIGPWCAMFVSWCDQLGDQPTKSFVKGSRYAYVPYIVSDARLGLNGLSVTSSPKPGDLICYDWDKSGAEHDHVGVFEKGTAADWQAIEGNTSTSDNSNGGEVMRRHRSSQDAHTVFVRVAE